VLAAMALGAVAAFDAPSTAQISVTCWKEYCVYDPLAKKQICVREEIPCPA
jgi:hypothetical protein